MNASVPLLTPAQWGTFLGFGAALVGLSIIDPRIAGTVGAGIIIVLVFKNAKGLGLE